MSSKTNPWFTPISCSDIKRQSSQKKNLHVRLCACTRRTGRRPTGQGAVDVRTPPHRRGDLNVGRSRRRVKHVGELVSSFIVYEQVGQTCRHRHGRATGNNTFPLLVVAGRGAEQVVDRFPSSSHWDGEQSRRWIEANGKRGGIFYMEYSLKTFKWDI
jgi:hypothetical protein